MTRPRVDKYLTIEEIEVYSLLDSYHEYWGTWPSRELMDKKLGKPIFTPLKKLVRKGLVTKTKTKPRTYKLDKTLYSKMLDRFLDNIFIWQDKIDRARGKGAEK